MHSHYSYSSLSPPLHSQPKQYPHIHTPTNTSTYINNTTTLYTKITLQATSSPIPSNINTHWLKQFNSTTSFISFCFLTGLPEGSTHSVAFSISAYLPVYLRYVHFHPPFPFLLAYLSTWGMYTFTHLSPCLPVYLRCVHLHSPFLLAYLSTWGVYTYIPPFSLLTCLPEVCTLTFPLLSLLTCLPEVCTLTFPLSACLPVYLRCVHLHSPFLLAYLSTWGVYTFTHLSPFCLLTSLPEVCTLTFPLSPCLPVYLRCVHLHSPFSLLTCLLEVCTPSPTFPLSEGSLSWWASPHQWVSPQWPWCSSSS